MINETEINPKNFHILVAEDEPFILKTYSIVLKSSGFTVSSAQNGEEALIKIREASETQKPVDILITDINMPEMSGEELIDQIKESRMNLAVIVITGFGNKELIVRLLRKGCDDYIEKPFTSRFFLGVVNNIAKKLYLKNKSVSPENNCSAEVQKVQEREETG